MNFNQQMTGQELRRAGRTLGVVAPVPSFADHPREAGARILLPRVASSGHLGRGSRLGRLLFVDGAHIAAVRFNPQSTHRFACKPVDASPEQPQPSVSAALFDGPHHHRKSAHELGEVSQGLGNV